MKLTFMSKGIVQIDDARIIWRNFRGEGGRYNKEGERNFCLVIPDQEAADALSAEGFNVKIKPPREEGDAPFMYLKIKVNFNDRGPNIYVQSGNSRIRLNEDTVRRLDRIDLMSVDMDIQRGREQWEINGQTGYAAYLRSMLAYQEVDRFAERYASEEFPEE